MGALNSEAFALAWRHACLPKETIHRAPPILRHFAEWVGNQEPLTFRIRSIPLGSTKPVND